MRIDGRALAQQLGEVLATKMSVLSHVPMLRVFVLSKDKATEQFINIKKRAGERVGVRVEIVELTTATTADLIQEIHGAVESADGIIIQLPLPEHIDTEAILKEIPGSHDVDGIGSSPRVLPPVVAAFEHILKEHKIDLTHKKVSVVGQGRLVGKPAAWWFESQGANVCVCDKESPLDVCLKDEDIIVLGAGSPHLLKPEMIKEGVIVLDAGTSEAGGKVVGDADPLCEPKASIFTPVPGGIGPLAVMMIFKNLYELQGRKDESIEYA